MARSHLGIEENGGQGSRPITSSAMRRARMLWLRTLLFTILVPGTELVLIPLVVVYFGVGPCFELGPARYSGLVPLLVGLVIILSLLRRFHSPRPRHAGDLRPAGRVGRRWTVPLCPQPAVCGRGAGHCRRGAVERNDRPVRLRRPHGDRLPPLRDVL